MGVKQQVAVIGDFPIDLWRDLPLRDTAWSVLREQAADIAAGRPGWMLTDEPGTRSSPIYMRLVDGPEGELMAVECTAEEAEFVKLRLAVWAIPAPGSGPGAAPAA